MSRNFTVLGAGMVGVCTALALAARGALLPILKEAGAEAVMRPRGELYVYRKCNGPGA